MSLSAQPDEDGEIDRLLIAALSRAGRTDELAALRDRISDVRIARSRAVALYETGDWNAAHAAYLALWDAHPSDFALPDATRLLLAAHEVRAPQTLDRLVEAFPILVDAPGWSEIARGLSDDPDIPAAFTSDLMRSSLRNADRALEAVIELTGALPVE